MRLGLGSGPRGRRSTPDGGFGDLSRAGLGQDGQKSILPAGLTGRGRRAAWQRARLRRVLSAGLVGAAAWVAMGALLPQPAPAGVPVVVVAQDLMAGHLLTQGDLVLADWPAGLSPRGAAKDPASLVGRSLGAGMSRGEPVTTARLRGPGLLTGVPTGLVAAHVRLADPAMSVMATAGDRVDLISPSGRLVTSDVTVLAVDARPAGSGAWSANQESGLPAGVVVAVSAAAAARLATADPSGLSDASFSLVMRKSGT